MKAFPRNFFAVFGLEPCPWVEPTLLKERFREVAARLHPDTCGGSMNEFTMLNEAFAVLRDPGQRLRHLVELAFPDHVQSVKGMPEEKLFFEVAEAIELGKKALVERKEVKTALGRAAFNKTLRETLLLNVQALKHVERELSFLENRLKSLGVDWRVPGPDFFMSIAAQFVYLQRWQRELSEMKFLLEERVRDY